MSKITKIEIITRPEMLDKLKAAMNSIRITGMTVSQVYGCGLSSGHKEIYRGHEVAVTLVPKIKVEIVVCDIPVARVVETAKKICCTGHIGDGKIFVYTIDNAIRIRTGEEGPEAISDRLDDLKIVNKIAAEAADE
ncbi:MAG: P-II family nitrogen regulator [Selenomonadaceae bacterium]